VVEQTLPGAQTGERDRRALDVPKLVRLGGEDVVRNSDVVRRRAVAVEAAEREDGFAGLGPFDAGTDGRDDAGELV
jgi:hypothetical protein